MQALSVLQEFYVLSQCLYVNAWCFILKAAASSFSADIDSTSHSMVTRSESPQNHVYEALQSR
jgi:hypothetical protein